jgi:serine/threonine protein kinase
MSQFLNPEEARLDPVLAGLSAGSRVGAGRFTLLRLLGRGGNGVVWLARDEHLRESVALKFLPPEIRHDAAALDDLRRETSRSRKLTHPHIIRIHDLYKTDQEAFISMEYVDGLNLSELRLQQPDRVLTWSFLEPLIKELCHALDYAHGERIIHRDLKPANMMIDGRGRLKLADFGIAAMVTDTVSRISVGRHALSGTACYMSPQQLDGKMPQVTDDIYSVGATLYELLASRAPFFTGDIPHQVRSFAPQPIDKRLSQLNLHNPVPAAVSSTIMACLAKEPEKRPQSARAIAEQIGLGPLPVNAPTDAPSHAEAPRPLERPAAQPQPPEAAAQAQVRSPSRSGGPVQTGVAIPQPPPQDRTLSSYQAPAPARRRSPILPLTVIVLAAILLAGAGTWWWWTQQGPGKAPSGMAAQPPAPEFIPLFNGHDFSGWEGDPEIWSVRDGAITATNGTSKERRPVALFWRGGSVEDFELRLSFRIRSGNSGIYYRAKQLLGHEVGGYQFEISGPMTGLLIESGPDRMRRQPSLPGSVTIAKVINGREKVTAERPTASDALQVRNAFRPGAWNDVVIIARSNHVVQALNGHTIIDTTDEFEKRPQRGTVALEVYGAVPTSVQFRNIRLKHLPPAGQ